MTYFIVLTLHLISDFLLIAGMLINSFVIGMVPPTIRTGVITALRKYDRTITTAALVGAWIFGLWLAFGYGFYKSGWFGFKFLIVLMLSALHGMQGAWMRRMEADPHIDPPAFVRAGMPIVIASLIVIVALAVIKPF